MNRSCLVFSILAIISSLTKLVSGVVLGKHASVNAGYQKLKDEIGVSFTATYGKLQRVAYNAFAIVKGAIEIVSRS